MPEIDVTQAKDSSNVNEGILAPPNSGRSFMSSPSTAPQNLPASGIDRIINAETLEVELPKPPQKDEGQTQEEETTIETPEKGKTTEDKSKDKGTKDKLTFETPKLEEKEEVVEEKLPNKEVNPPFRPAKRDYSSFDPEDVPQLKKLPNQLFAAVAPFALKNKELKDQFNAQKVEFDKIKSGALPDTWAEHPDAYVLTPQFKEINNQLVYDNFEENHWTQQLIAIKQGQDWYDIKGYDEKTGQPVYDLIKAKGEGQFDPASEIQVSKYLNNVQVNKSFRQGQLINLQNSHTKIHQDALGYLKEAENQFFPSWNDPAKIPPDAKKNIEAVIERMHPTFKNHPSTMLLAKSYAFSRQLVEEVKRLRDEVKTLKDKTQDRLKAGPPNGSFVGGGVKAGKFISIEDFER